MWDNGHGFASTGQFQHSFNQEKYQPLMFAGNGQPGQEQYSIQQPNAPHPNKQYDSSHGEGFPPEFPPQTYNIPPRTTAGLRPPTQINARAAELKAELVKRRERKASSATPPVTQKIPSLASKQTAPREEPGSLGIAPKPSTTFEKPEQKINIDELISLHSKVADTAAKPESKSINTSSFPGMAVHKGANSQPSLGESSMSAMKPANLGLVKFLQGDRHPNGSTLGDGHTSNGSLSDGEIVEDESTPPRSVPVAEPKEIKSSAIVAKIDGAQFRRSRAEQGGKAPPSDRLPRDESPPRRPVAIPKPQGTRSRDDCWEDFDARGKRDYHIFKSDYKERKQYHEPESIVRPRQDSREDNHRRTELNGQRRSEAFASLPREPPTLKDILPLDEDLREWLEITGYHNAPYRSKILNRRRAIAALDAKRQQLLAEMQAEERGGVPQILEGQVPALSIARPISVNRTGVRNEPASAAAEDALERDLVVSNKRPYSEIQDTRRDEFMGGKVARTDDRPYFTQRVKEEERPRSGSFDYSSSDRRDRANSRPRYDYRARSRDREISPGRDGRREYESRPAARGRGYDLDSFYDRDDDLERGPRAFEIRGNYRGRAFDPNYRGRGRGRGRGDPRDSRDFRSGSDAKSESGYGSYIANGKQSRDLRGFDRGGRGGL
ncbi:hypothetical protein QTJ16_003278 [Diplocarpon rosae]|uniref:Uncharacterized protein n=1 Tax=Diplocarpon rosae TaxID=946125 RepID=A0AAD9T1C7_9HELO|nr:hypothetical protein QTJ16_003278 [Diplocarpon rosae]